MALWEFITGPQAWTFWAVVLSTSIATAILNHLVDGLRTSWKNRRSAAHLALRVAVQLERFADECSERVAHNEYQTLSDGGGGWVSLPTPPAYPEDDEAWKVLSTELAARALSFPNLVLSSQNHIVEIQRISHGQGGESVCQEECALRGMDAWNLAVDLRRRYHLGTFVPADDFPKWLVQEAKSVRARRADHLANNAAAKRDAFEHREGGLPKAGKQTAGVVPSAASIPSLARGP